MAKKYQRANINITECSIVSENSAPAGGALMVCVTNQRSCERLIRRGYELRTEQQRFYVVHCVQTGRVFMNSSSDSTAIEFLFSYASLVDAELAILREDDVVEGLVNFAKAHNVTSIVLGASPKQDDNSFSARLASRLSNVDFIIVD